MLACDVLPTAPPESEAVTPSPVCREGGSAPVCAHVQVTPNPKIYVTPRELTAAMSSRKAAMSSRKAAVSSWQG